MKHFLLIFSFTVVVSLMYTGVAQLLPQLPSYPPTKVELGSNIGPADLSAAGQGVFEANCSSCHKMGESARGPDLSGMGTRAHARAAERAEKTGKAFTDVDYLVEALCKPGDYLAEGFGNIMPPQGKALSGGQVLAAVAFLQDLGGEATVKGTDVGPVERFGCVSAGGGAGGGDAAVEAEPVGSPEEVLQTFGCTGCHSVDSTARLMGPSLFDVGSRLDKGEIYESLLAPDAVLSPGAPPYQGAVMKGTLDGNGFYDRMTPGDYQALVDWLAEKKG